MGYVSAEFSIMTSENTSRSRQAASQSMVNLYTEQQASGRTEFIVMPWPGEKLFSAGTKGETRGFHVVNGVPYVVNERNLYKITAQGEQVRLADIAGYGRVSMEDDGFNLLIRTRGSVAFINGKFILQGNGVSYLWNGNSLQTLSLPELTNNDEFVVSLVDEPTNYPGWNIGNAIIKGDGLRQIKVHQRKIVCGGDSSMEFQLDTGEGQPPIQSVAQASNVLTGVASAHSMAATPTFLYFLGSDGVVYRNFNYDIEPVSTSSISKDVRLNDYSDALGFCVQLDSQWFYILQLPTANRTYAYSEQGNYWIRLSSGTSRLLGKHLMAGYVFAYGKHLIVDSTTSTVYEWHFSTYSSNGKPIVRELVTAPINGMMIGAPGKRLITKGMRLIMETGVGNHAKEDPVVMVSASYDGGKSYADEHWLPIFRAGQALSLVDWQFCATFYDLVIKIRVSDPVFTSFHTASIDLKTAGW